MKKRAGAGTYKILSIDHWLKPYSQDIALRVNNHTKALKELLFDDLRIDEGAFFALQKDDISQLAPLYRATNLKLLAKFMEGR